MNSDTRALMCFVVALSGCVSLKVDDETLMQKTAFALGVSPSTISIIGRQQVGSQWRYQVKTQTGKRFHCYVESGSTLFYRVVSDAVCHVDNELPPNPLLKKARPQA